MINFDAEGDAELVVGPGEEHGEPPRTLRGVRQWLSRVLPFVSGVISVLVALLLYRVFLPPAQPLTEREVRETVAQALASATPRAAFSAQVYQAIQPSLVLVQARLPDESGEEQNSLGSGVVINENGDILTSLHVVKDATAIEVLFADGSESSAQLINSQPENDIAVLSATAIPDVVVPATLGNPNAMRVGDEAFAVGHPFGLYGSMSAGVISGFNRSFRPEESGQELNGLIQIDAAVNSGNSGGPLLNRSGQVIGIVVGIVNPTREKVFVGVGFAVPIPVAVSAVGPAPY